MGLLFSDEIKEQLANELNRTKNDIHIISAYCKKSALEFVESCVDSSILNKKIMVRFSYDDILKGASDLGVYNFCRNHGWKLFMRLDLHAKTYIFDKIRCLVGSANLTSRGINISKNMNYEIAMMTSISDKDMYRIESMFDNAVEVNDELYEKMKFCISSHSVELGEGGNWSQEILELFNTKVEVLFTYDFPNCYSLSSMKEDSLDFLKLDSGWTIPMVKKEFMKSNVYRWLKEVLNTKHNKEIYYGELSALVHNVIINDPKPYRKEVKELQSNLLNWITELEIDEVTIDRPNYSQRIKLNEEGDS